MARTYVLSREFEFQAAHALPSLPPEHPCHKMHGHTWQAMVTLASADVDKHGMVIDLNLFRELINALDHGCLNDLMPQPTMENCAAYIWEWVDRKLWSVLGAQDRGEITILRVRVAENARNQVELMADVMPST